MSEGARRVVLGRLRRPWGRHGELLVEVHTDWPERRFAHGTAVDLRWENGRTARRTVRAFRELTLGSLIAFEGIDGIGPAQDLAGAWLEAEADTRAAAADGEWTHSDLVGLTVVTVGGATVGTVDGIEEGAGPDLLRIAGRSGEILVPLVPAICVTIEPGAGRITIDPPPGLLNLDEAETAGP